MRSILVLLVALVSAGVASAPASASPRAPGPATSAAVPAQVDSLTVDATTTYRLEPDAAVIRVTVEVTLTNTEPSRRRGNVIETPFFDSFGTAAIGPVANASADRGGQGLTTSVQPGDSDDVDFIVVDLSPNLVFGSPQTVTIRYDIPAQASRSDFATRINGAFASWYAVGTGDGGAIDIVVDVPERFEVEFTDIAMPDPVVADGRAVHRLEQVGLEQSFFGVSARDDAALVKRTTGVDDDDFEIQAWPGDEVWADFAVDAVDRGVPVLVARTGIDLAGERDIEIAETATPYLYGYAGWFLPEEDRIEIGDELDLQVMLHELSHLWFNGDLFDSRWINEGLAEVVSNDVARSFDETFVEVEPIDTAAPGAQPLNQWQNPGADEDADAVETYGYRSSYAVMHALFEDVGADGLRTLVSHADRGLLPYVGDPEAEASTARTDWRYFYDIADRVVGSDQLGPLFDDYVLDDADRSAVADRAAAIDRYDALTDAGGEWSPPLEVRRLMASWSFGNATAAIDDAEDLLEERASLQAALGPRGIPVPAAIEESYETAVDVDETSELVAALAVVAPDVADADAAIDGVNPVEAIGLIGSDASDDRDAALRRFAAGDADGAARAAADAQSAADGALAAALLRLGVVVLLASVVVVIVRRRRRASRRRSAQDERAEPAEPAEADLGP